MLFHWSVSASLKAEAPSLRLSLKIGLGRYLCSFLSDSLMGAS
jgi:hypothetical protein